MYHADFVYYTAVNSYDLATMTTLTASLHAAGMFSFKQLRIPSLAQTSVGLSIINSKFLSVCHINVTLSHH